MIVLRIDRESPPAPAVTIEPVSDPAECERVRSVVEAGRRNRDWLASQWSSLLPQALGKYVAVGDQQAQLAGTSEEAWAWIRSNHAEDRGAFVQYVLPHQGPRIYAPSR
jgi:hypothetical protein